MSDIKEISVGNYYGNLCLRKYGDEFYWCVENWDGFHWSKIPESLYRELIKFEANQ